MNLTLNNFYFEAKSLGKEVWDSSGHLTWSESKYIFFYVFYLYCFSGQMFALTRRCPCWGNVSHVSMLLPTWWRCGGRAVQAPCGAQDMKEGQRESYLHNENTLKVQIDCLMSLKWSSTPYTSSVSSSGQHTTCLINRCIAWICTQSISAVLDGHRRKMRWAVFIVSA